MFEPAGSDLVGNVEVFARHCEEGRVEPFTARGQRERRGLDLGSIPSNQDVGTTSSNRCRTFTQRKLDPCCGGRPHQSKLSLGQLTVLEGLRTPQTTYTPPPTT